MLSPLSSGQKRQNGRSLARFKVRYGNREPLRTGFTENVSEGGLFLKGNFLFRCLTLVRIEIIIPDEEHVLFIGQVCWVRRPSPLFPRMGRMGGMGIRIVRFIENPARYLVLCKELQGGA